jgi:hypothetical protein
MVDVATAEAPTTLVYMDFAAADATADGLAALLPMVESLGYPTATE